jgi:hypothetical protein
MQPYAGSSSGFAAYAQAQQHAPPPLSARHTSAHSAAPVYTPYQAAQSPYVEVGTNLQRRGYDPYANQRAAAAREQAPPKQALPEQAPTEQASPDDHTMQPPE